jgi:S1-C subfamily serine protease
MKLLFPILLVIFLFTALVQAQESLPDLAKRIRPSVVTITANDKANAVIEIGSGFFVELPANSTSKQTEDVKTFARRIRNKSESYYDKTDIELVRRVLEKYPEYKERVTFSFSLEDKVPKITRVNSSPKGTFVVTNWHVVKDAKSVNIKTQDKQTFKAIVVAYSEPGDIVLLQTEAPKGKYNSLDLADNYPEEGENILVIGNPLGLFEGSLSTGIISATRDLPSIGEVLQITAPVSPGNSGSPVMNSEGDVIGIVTFNVAKGQNLNFAISKRLLERLLCPQDPIGLYR